MTTASWASGQERGAGRTRLLDRPLASYYLVLGSAGLLVVLGLVMVLSASSVQAYAVSHSSFSVGAKQAMWVAIGLPVLWVGSRMPVKGFRWLGYPLLLVSLGALVLVPVIGHGVFDAKRWIQLGPFQLQPSEPAKLALVLWGADLLARKEKLLDQPKHLLIPLLPVVLLMAGLVMVEPDLGTTLVLLVVMLAMIFVAGAPLRVFAGMLGLVGAGVGMMAVAEPYRLARLTSFLHPFRDQLGNGYQAVQGIYALASGGWWGVGLGASREKWAYLPNQYTDYIFAIIGEELGLIGCVVVLVLFGTLGYAGIRIAGRSQDPFVRLATTGITAWLLAQALVNVGYVVGLLPVTGIPLPMVSFGGSSLVPTLFGIGMLLSFARNEPAARRALLLRGPGPVRRALVNRMPLRRG